MIVGAAVCPGAPFLIDGVADPLAIRLGPVGAACGLALAALPDADVVLLVTTGLIPPAGEPSGSWQVFPPGTVVPTTSVRRSDLAAPRIRLSSGASRRPGPTVAEPAVGTMVGAQLLANAGVAAAATAIEIIGDPGPAAAMLAGQTSSTERVGVLVIADGCACHGPDAPGKQDDRSGPFDAALAAALAAGDPDGLALTCADRVLAGDLLASVDPLAVLALLTVDRPPDAAELLYAAAPLGVGYLVASWRWSQR